MAKGLVITEKPSVARDISEALGGFEEHDGYFENDDYVVTFAVGHLFELLPPEEVDEKYKRWTLDVLPILPEKFELRKKKGQSDRIRTIQKLLRRDDVDRVINACDAGREGELIFREIVKFLGNEKPIQRLWLQSMTKDAIAKGFASLLPGAEMEGLARAAECRAYSDWLIGMNATRAITKRLKTRKERTSWSAGRVQTPTLALLVARELEVLSHVPVAYWKVTGRFEHQGHAYSGAWYDPAFEASDDDQRKDDRLFDEARARAIVAAAAGEAGEARETRKPSRESAPPLFDLTSLQREGNRRFGWSARRTLGAAQRCYERHKLLTYPRTDSRCLPEDYRATVDGVLNAYAGAASDELDDYAAAAQRLLEQGLENTGRIFDNDAVSDHFAIVPTGTLPPEDMSSDDRRLFDLVVRRFFGAFHPPALWERVERVTEVAGESFRTRTRALMEPGWRAVLPAGDEETSAPLAPLRAGESDVTGVAVDVREVELEADETKPPPRVTEARLLSLMENAGKIVEDEDADLAAHLHERGLGTPATRADVIENLITKGYANRQGKSIRPTVKGIRLIDTLQRVHIDRLSSAKLTGEIEKHLGEVEAGDRTADEFMSEIADYAKEIVHVAKTFEYGDLYKDEPALGACPACGRPVIEMAWFYRCEEQEGVERDDDCPMRFWKDTSGRYLDRAAVAALIRDGRTPVLDGFTARNGRTYKGTIELDTDEWKLKVQSEGWNEDGGYQLPEYEVDPEPLGPCPFSSECEVIETATHFLCTTRLAADEAQAAYKEARKLAREQGEKGPDKPEKPDHAGFLFPRTVCKREITREEALYYLEHGKTELLEDFTSRFGRPFSATLVLKETGRHGFEFPPRKKAAKKGEGDAAEGAEAPAKKAARKPTKQATRKKTTKAAKAAKAAGKKTTRKAGRKRAATKTVAKKTAAKKTSAKKKSSKKTSSKKTPAKTPAKKTGPTARKSAKSGAVKSTRPPARKGATRGDVPVEPGPARPAEGD